MDIRMYTAADAPAMFSLLEREGGDWQAYFKEQREAYAAVLETSVTYLAFENGALCGYCRCREDGGFGVYVYDLLVDKAYRGHRFGHKLMSRVCDDYPEEPVYVMSDVDGYYKKQGYRREGSIFEVVP